MYEFPKAHRVAGKKAVERLFATGTGGFVYPLRYLFVTADASEGSAGVAVLTGVPKKLHKRANRRNLLKRRMREAFRTRDGELRVRAVESGLHVDIALMYGVKEVVEFDRISDAVTKILAQVGNRAACPRRAEN